MVTEWTVENKTNMATNYGHYSTECQHNLYVARQDILSHVSNTGSFKPLV
jgi:hypothetical protein